MMSWLSGSGSGEDLDVCVAKGSQEVGKDDDRRRFCLFEQAGIQRLSQEYLVGPAPSLTLQLWVSSCEEPFVPIVHVSGVVVDGYVLDLCFRELDGD